MTTKTKRPRAKANDWFEIDGRQIGCAKFQGASGGPLSVPLDSRSAAEVRRWQLPAGVVLVHACCVSVHLIIGDLLGPAWPDHEQGFPGNPSRDWTKVVVSVRALRHVFDILTRDRQRERNSDLLCRGTGQEVAREVVHAHNQAVCDWDPFESICAQVLVLNDRGPTRGRTTDQLRIPHASFHHAVRAVAGDVLHSLESCFDRVGLLQDDARIRDPASCVGRRESWAEAIARCSTQGAFLLQRAWDSAAATGDEGCRNLPNFYWPHWGGLRSMLSAEMSRLSIGNALRGAPSSSMPWAPTNLREAILCALEQQPGGTLASWAEVFESVRALGYLDVGEVRREGPALKQAGLVDCPGNHPRIQPTITPKGRGLLEARRRR